MKQVNLLLLVTVLLLSCKKDNNDCTAYLTFTSSTSPSITTINAGITTSISGYGANSCYQFTGTEITPTSSTVFEIRLKGKLPCYPTACADVLIGVMDTITISTPIAGTYYLKFINGPSVEKIDTVIVN